MRIFDEDEKQIIKKIIHGEGYARTLINLIDSQRNLQNTRIEIDKENRKAGFLFQMQNEEPNDDECRWGIENQKQLTELIIKYVTLFRYLEKEELAIFFDPTKSDEKVITFGMGAVNMPSFRMSIDDQNVVDLLIKYVHKEIMPSPSLRTLENNQYIPDEEIRFGKQQKAIWAAIIVSILLGFYGIYNNYQNSKSQEKQLNAQIQESRKIADSIINKINEYESSKIDYRPTIKEISKSLSEIGARVDLAPKNQTIEVKFLNQTEEHKK